MNFYIKTFFKTFFKTLLQCFPMVMIIIICIIILANPEKVIVDTTGTQNIYNENNSKVLCIYYEKENIYEFNVIFNNRFTGADNISKIYFQTGDENIIKKLKSGMFKLTLKVIYNAVDKKTTAFYKIVELNKTNPNNSFQKNKKLKEDFSS